VSDDDPFDRLGDAADREGDPFETLDDAEHATDAGTDTAGTTGPQPETGDETDTVGATGADAEAGVTGTDAENGTGPADGSEESLSGPETGTTPEGPDRDRSMPGWLEPAESRERGAGTPVAPSGEAGETDGVFERMEVDQVDADAVWDRLGADRASASDRGERDIASVSKHRFCEQCEHFTPPPDVACTHEGTEILEFPDMETVRVADCPVVADRRGLEEREQF
jgi:hypothetical protein